MGGKYGVKKQSPHFWWTLFFSRAGKKQSPQKVRTLIFFTAFSPPCLGLRFFSEPKFLDSSLRHFLFYAGARALDMASWHVMAL